MQQGLRGWDGTTIVISAILMKCGNYSLLPIRTSVTSGEYVTSTIPIHGAGGWVFGGLAAIRPEVKGARRMCPSTAHALPSRRCPRLRNNRILCPRGRKPPSKPYTGRFSRFIPEDRTYHEVYIPIPWSVQGAALFWKCGWICRLEY